MTIDNNEYQGNLAVLDGVAIASFPNVLSLETVKTLMSAETIDSYSLTSFKSCRLTENSTEIRWLVEDATQKELNEANSKLTAITEAITALGTGIPTLAKLKDFLNAVKEAVGYGTDN